VTGRIRIYKLKYSKGHFMLPFQYFGNVEEIYFALVDIAYLSTGKCHAVATIDFTESWILLIYAISYRIKYAGNRIVPDRIGEKNIKEPGKLQVQAIIGIA